MQGSKLAHMLTTGTNRSRHRTSNPQVSLQIRLQKFVAADQRELLEVSYSKGCPTRWGHQWIRSKRASIAAYFRIPVRVNDKHMLLERSSRLQESHSLLEHGKPGVKSGVGLREGSLAVPSPRRQLNQKCSNLRYQRAPRRILFVSTAFDQTTPNAAHRFDAMHVVRSKALSASVSRRS